jgi:hypothetical protein
LIAVLTEGLVPQGYDAITLNYWLWFKHRCHEGSATEFQSLFEAIIKRAKPEFVQIRPYGNIGDRKCDGLYFADGTIFQVYSPDEFRQAELQKKVNEDLDGAVKHWGKGLRKWIFVYNVRRGLPPDIAGLLFEKRKQYPEIVIEPLSSDGLWELARNLATQQKAEIFGAPTGYEHLFMALATQPDDIRKYLDHGWFVLVQDILSPINLRSVIDALEPELPFGAPLHVNPGANHADLSVPAGYQKQVLLEALEKSRDCVPRFAVFSLAPIPLAVHLGFVLSDRLEVRCFHFDRDRATWAWDSATAADTGVTVSGLPDGTIHDRTDVAIRISLSDRVSPHDAREAAPDARVAVDIAVPNPNVTWLQSPTQLEVLGRTIRDTLALLRERVPKCMQLHLFYAGPTGGAVVLGQQINPRMNPPAVVYEYSRQKQPRHRPALTLSDE